MKHQCLQIFPCLLVLCVLHNACFVCSAYRAVQRQVKTMLTGLFGSISSQLFALTTARFFFVYFLCLLRLLSHHSPFPFLFVYSTCRVDSCCAVAISCHVSSPPWRTVVAPRPPFVCLHMFAFFLYFFQLFACSFVIFIYLIWFVCLFVFVRRSPPRARKFAPLCLSSLTQICYSPLVQIVTPLPLPPHTISPSPIAQICPYYLRSNPALPCPNPIPNPCPYPSPNPSPSQYMSLPML